MTAGDVGALIVLSIVATVWLVTRYLATSRRARVQVTSGQDYRALAEEFRRLTDMAVTAQEHVDLRLTDITVQVDTLRTQLEKMQRILTEVE